MEEIYDDTAVLDEPVKSTEEPVKSAISALKSKFDVPKNAASPGGRPFVTPKPKVANRWGGGGNLNVVGGVDKKDNEIVKAGFNKPGNVGLQGKENVLNKDKSSNSAAVNGLEKRNSKTISIPAAFIQKQEPPVADKPKPNLKIKPLPPRWKTTNDTNNNNPKLPESQSPNSLKSAPFESKKEQDKNSEKTGNISPRGMPENSIKSPGSATKDKMFHKNPLPVSNMFGGQSPKDMLAHLKHVPPATESSVQPSSLRKTSPWKPPATNTESTGGVVLRNDAFNMFGQRVSTKRKSIKSVIRKIDDKKFHKQTDNCEKDWGEAPAKPDKLDCEIDWEHLIQEYDGAKQKIDPTLSGGITEVDEVYDDCGNRVSLIQPMTEDEELEDDEKWNNAGFRGLAENNEDLPPPPPDDELYDDTATAVPPAPPPDTDLPPPEDTDQLYEYLEDDPPPTPGPNPDAPPPVGPKAPPSKMDKLPDPPVKPPEKPKDSKELEKERKKKEKEEKKLMEKKKKELEKMMKTFKIDAEGLMQSLCKGTVKNTCKANKHNIAVQGGERVDVIRMVSNPEGKWLVRLSSAQTVGYVDAGNIEVDTDIIRGVMQESHTATPAKSSQSQQDDDQEEYEDVDGVGAGGGEEEPTQDEIYEVLE